MLDKVLEILSDTDGYVSGQSMSEQLGVSRQSIWKAINSLKNKGYEIKSITNKGYRLLSAPEYINEQSLRKYLDTSVIGKDLEVLETVGSTNDYLKRKAENGCINGAVVVAREQTKGKGRLGREWQTKKDDGIAFSFLLRPGIAPSQTGSITPLAGLAVCKALREYTGLDCRIKWPNDIIIGRKKLVGILTEMSAEFDAVEYIICGIGINAEHTEFPDEIAYKATSILLETGVHINKNEFLACVLKHIEDEFSRSNLVLNKTALQEYTQLCATVGRDVLFSRGEKQVSAKAVGIEPDGELRVELEDGSICNINSGEVTVQGIY